jgi:hypothetical protein
MTGLFKPASLTKLGDRLPPATRFCRVSGNESTALAVEYIVAFVPCRRFERDGLYLFHAASDYQVYECRSLARGREIEIINAGRRMTVSKDRFGAAIEGRVIGIALVSDLSLAQGPPLRVQLPWVAGEPLCSKEKPCIVPTR